MRISATEYPLLHEVANGATWVGTDEFPSCSEWADEHETWLRFVREARALPHYLPRLRGPKERRDEAFAEIAPAYFFATKCGLSIFEWEPLGANGKRRRVPYGLRQTLAGLRRGKGSGLGGRDRERARVRRARASSSRSTSASRLASLHPGCRPG